MFKLIIDILSVPAILVGLIAMIGLLLQKKSVDVVIKGTIKTILGFLVLTGGASIISGSIGNFGTMFQYAFGIKGVYPNNEAVVALALKTYGSQTALIMALGMIVNILIARYTKFKYIFLTGQHTLYMACMIAVILVSYGIKGAPLVISGSLLLGFVMAFFPAIAQPAMKKITGSDDVAFGHFGTVGYLVAAGVGKLVGKNSKSTEEMEVPKRLSFLRDSSVCISLTMGILFVILALVCGPTYIQSKVSKGQNYLVFSILQAITFAAGIYIVLSGVRLILAEIVPAFKGISEKFVPNAKPALDCPVVFPYAPNAVLIGFLACWIGMIVGMAFLLIVNKSLLVSGIIPLAIIIPHGFFHGATGGVFGNAYGGRKGAFWGPFVQGILVTFLPALLMPMLGQLGFANTTFSDADFSVVGIFLGNILKLIAH